MEATTKVQYRTLRIQLLHSTCRASGSRRMSVIESAGDPESGVIARLGCESCGQGVEISTIGDDLDAPAMEAIADVLINRGLVSD